MPINSDERTNGGSRTMEEISKSIRSAGAEEQIEDQRPAEKHDPRVSPDPDAPEDKVVVPPPATDDAVVTNPEDAAVEPPEPQKKTPEKMKTHPANLLYPPEQPRNPEFPEEAGVPPEHAEPGTPQKPEVDEEVVEAMKADEQITQAMKEAKEKHDAEARRQLED